MIRGRRPAAPRGRRRIGLLAVGLLAALSLVWQQQASLASFTDKEFANASFSSATLSAIAPTMEPDPDRILVKWAAPVKQWATPQYQLYWSATGSGSGTNLHSGPSNDRQYNHDTGTNVPADANLLFTEVAAGDTHACGISQGTVYCWGTNDYGELGLGTTTAAAAPKAVTYGGLVGRFATDVTAGTDFTCAIADGQAFCWGRGASGRLGTGNSANATTPTAVTTNTMIGTVTSLSAGGSHACAVAAGVAYCWGLGDDGRLGNGASSGSQVNPIAVTTSSTPLAGRTISSISAGTSHSCAVADAMAFCWGLNTNGRLGDNTTTARTTAVAVLTSGVLMGRSVSRISAGAAHTCAIADAKAFCWGNGASGRLGNSTTSQSLAPVAVTTSSMSGSVSAISAGSAHTCAIASAAAWCWGAGTSYGLGNGSTANLSAPGTVTAAAGVLSERTLTSISTGTSFGCVTGNTPAACWGLGTSNQMGDNSATTNQTPANVILVGKVCANGSVRRSATACSLTQGTDYYYRLGYTIGAWSAPDSGWQKSTTAVRSGVTPSVNSSTTTSITLDWAAAEKAIQAYPEYTVQRSLVADGSSPTTIAITGVRLLTDPGGLATQRDFTAISSGAGHSCGIAGGELYCWGLNSSGQLGIGSTNDTSRPTKVAGLLVGKTVTAVSAGANHTCVIADTQAYCWGQNSFGQLGDNSVQMRNVPTAVSGQAGVNVTAISAGTSHTCGIGNGIAYCWGSNGNGQLGLGNTSNSSVPVAVVASGVLAGKTPTAVAAGGSHTCLIASGAAYCWGLNGNGQVGDNSATQRTSPVAVNTTTGLSGKTVTAVTAGERHSCVIASSVAYCWGADANGQIGNSATLTTTYSTPQAVLTTGALSGKTPTAISAGQYHTCVVASAAAVCWGENTASQLGNSLTADSGVPVAVTAGGAFSAVTAITGGYTHSCAVASGGAFCWGEGTSGRLGNGTTTAYSVPQATVYDARCAKGASQLGDGSCSLRPGTTYYYRITFTLDGNTTTAGAWTPLATSS